MSRIGLVCAMRSEHACLSLPGGSEWESPESGPFPVYAASMDDTEAVCVVGGVGKGAAAASTQFLIDRYSPLAIISFGLAGALEEAVAGDIVFPAQVVQGDTGIYDRRGFQAPLSWAEGETRRRLHHEYPADPVIHGWGRGFLRERGIECLTGPLVTCDQAVFSTHRRRELSRVFRAVAVDMESGAVAQVAALNGVPFAALRAISDAHDLEIEDFTQLSRLQADSVSTRIQGALGSLRDSRHRKFIKEMRAGSGRAFDRLGSLIPAFVEHCPFPS